MILDAADTGPGVGVPESDYKLAIRYYHLPLFLLGTEGVPNLRFRNIPKSFLHSSKRLVFKEKLVDELIKNTLIVAVETDHC